MQPIKRSLILLLLTGVYFLGIGQVTIDFTASDTTGCGSLQVAFSDNSTSTAGAIVAWDWDLGGVASSNPNPGRIFGTPGAFDICLTVTDAAGNTASLCKEGFIQVFELPQPEFSSSPTEGCAPLEVTFQDLSEPGDGAITEWVWGVGGNCGVVFTSTADTSFSCLYDIPDQYGVSLTLFDENGCSNTINKMNLIEAFAVPELDITSDVNSSCTFPFEVNFFNNNIQPGVNYEWNFGNGIQFSGATPPPVFYNANGNYSVTVIAQDPSSGCADTLVLEDFINVGGIVEFETSPQEGCLGEEFVFSDFSPETADSILWDFGDGNISSLFNPSHFYNAPGCYTITLTRYLDNCIQVDSFSCIEVLPIPDISFTFDHPQACELPHIVEFFGVANDPNIVSWQWNFGDGNSGTGPNPIHEYNSFGNFPVTLTVQNINGCVQTVSTGVVEIQPLTANVLDAEIGGCTPLSFTLEDNSSSIVPITSWYWEFTTPAGVFSSTDPNPSFSVVDTGRYDVTLIVENMLGCVDTAVFEEMIQVGLVPQGTFFADPLQACVEAPVQFFESVSDFTDAILWDFDGNGSIDGMGENPTHNYSDPDIYDVTMFLSHNGCTEEVTLTDYVEILVPLALFDVVRSCDDPYTVTVINESVGATSLTWDMGDPSTTIDISNQDTFTYTYPQTGDYTISLNISNATTGCTHANSSTISITEPEAQFDLSPTTGCVPLEVGVVNNSAFAESFTWSAPGGQIIGATAAEPLIVYPDSGAFTNVQLIITDLNGCQDTTLFTDSIFVNGIDIDFLINPIPLCTPASVMLTNNSTNLYGQSVQWEWMIGDSLAFYLGESVSFLLDTTGTFSVTLQVTDNLGCTNEATLEDALVASMPVASFESETLGCIDGPIEFINLSEGEGMTYLWEFGDNNTSTQINPVHSYATEDTFSVCLTVTDFNGCENTFCRDIEIAEPIAAFEADSTFAFCPPLTVNFTNLSENATSYFWDFGDSSGVSTLVNPPKIYTEPGIYDVSLIAVRSSVCADTITLGDYITINGPVGDFTFQVDTSCIPMTVTFFAESNDNYLYIWDYDDGSSLDSAFNAITDTASHVYAEVDIYTPRFSMVDDFGCKVTIESPDSIIAPFLELDFQTLDAQACESLNTTFVNLSTSTLPIEFTFWEFEGGNPVNTDESEPVVSYSTPGLYDVTLIAGNGFCTDTLTVPELIEIGEPPIAGFDMLPDQGCAPLEVQFIDQSSVQFGDIISWDWTFEGNGTSVEQNPMRTFSVEDSITVQLIVESSLGCLDTVADILSVFPVVDISLNAPSTICRGQSVQLQATITGDTAGLMLSWLPTLGLSCTDCLNPVASPNDSTLYTLTATTPEGCVTTAGVQVNVRPFEAPQITLTEDTTICANTFVQLFATGGDQPQDYLWDSSREGLSCYQACNNPIATPQVTTTYIVSVTNDFACISVDSVEVQVIEADQDFLGEDRVICLGDEINLSIDPSAGDQPFWQPSTGLSCVFCYDPVGRPQTPTLYIADITSPEGCPIRDSVFIDVLTAADIDAGRDTVVCLGESMILNGSGSGIPSWSPAGVLDNPMILNPEAFPEESATFYLTLESGNCILTDSVTIAIADLVEIEAQGGVICEGERIQLTVKGNASAYLWSPSDLVDNPNSNSPFAAPLSSTEFTVIGARASCTPDTAVVQVEVNPNPEFMLLDRYFFFPGQELQLDATAQGAGTYDYDWVPSIGLSCDFCPNPTVAIEQTTEYRLTVTNRQTGCSATQTTLIQLLNDCPETLISVPNAFTPNGDGENDVLMITRSQSIERINSFSIFDRWGELVFETSDINATWNGEFRGAQMLPGVYVYFLEAVCPLNNELIQLWGDISLIR